MRDARPGRGDGGRSGGGGADGRATEILVKVQDQALTLVMHKRSDAQPGSRVHLRSQAEHAHLFDAATAARP
jgi:hypothetical protein